MTDRRNNSGKKSGAGERKRSRLAMALAALATMAGLCSCTTASRRPDALLHDADTFVSLPTISASPETQYTLMKWFCATHQTVPGAAEALAMAQRRLAKSERDLFAQWSSELLRDFSPYLRPDGPYRFHLESKAFTGTETPDEIISLMNRLKARLVNEFEIRIDTEACLSDAIWGQQPLATREKFSVWLASFPRGLPFPEEVDFSGLLMQMDEIVQAAKLRSDVEQALGESEVAEKFRRSGVALHNLRALKRRLEQSQDLLAKINDAGTLEQIGERITYLSQLSVNEELSMIEVVAVSPAEVNGGDSVDLTPDRLAAQAERVGTAEKRLTSSLTTWSEDPLFAVSLEKYNSTIRSLLKRVCDLRISLCNQQLEHLFHNQSAWNSAIFLREQFAELNDADSARFGCYHFGNQNLADRIRAEVSETYCAPLAPLCQELVKTADKQAELALEHGASIAMCSVVLDMVGIVDKDTLPPELASLADAATQRLEKSVAFFQRQMGRRKVIIGEFESVIAGLGMIFQRDLSQLLGKALTDEVDGELIEIQSGTEHAKGDYTTTNGFIADFDATETTETQQFRTLKRWGDIREKPNPEYARLLAQGEREPAVPPKIYEQTQQEYAIRVLTVERLGHVRLSFDIVQDDNVSPVALNHFFRRRFVREEIHPFADIRDLRTVKAYSKDRLHPVEPEPVLRADRIWTESEMLDWLRRITQELIALKISQHVQTFSLQLAKDAEKLAAEGQLLKAVDTWGYCYQYCRINTSTDADSNWLKNLELLSLSDDETVKKVIEEAGEQWEQRQELHSRIQNQMAGAIMQFLRERED